MGVASVFWAFARLSEGFDDGFDGTGGRVAGGGGARGGGGGGGGGGGLSLALRALHWRASELLPQFNNQDCANTLWALARLSHHGSHAASAATGESSGPGGGDPSSPPSSSVPPPPPALVLGLAARAADDGNAATLRAGESPACDALVVRSLRRESESGRQTATSRVRVWSSDRYVPSPRPTEGWSSRARFLARRVPSAGRLVGGGFGR